MVRSQQEIMIKHAVKALSKPKLSGNKQFKDRPEEAFKSIKPTPDRRVTMSRINTGSKKKPAVVKSNYSLTQRLEEKSVEDLSAIKRTFDCTSALASEAKQANTSIDQVIPKKISTAEKPKSSVKISHLQRKPLLIQSGTKTKSDKKTPLKPESVKNANKVAIAMVSNFDQEIATLKQKVTVKTAGQKKPPKKSESMQQTDCYPSQYPYL